MVLGWGGGRGTCSLVVEYQSALCRLCTLSPQWGPRWAMWHPAAQRCQQTAPEPLLLCLLLQLLLLVLAPKCRDLQPKWRGKRGEGQWTSLEVRLKRTRTLRKSLLLWPASHSTRTRPSSSPRRVGTPPLLHLVHWPLAEWSCRPCRRTPGRAIQVRRRQGHSLRVPPLSRDAWKLTHRFSETCANASPSHILLFLRSSQSLQGGRQSTSAFRER